MLQLRVVERRDEAESIRSYVLAEVAGKPLPPFTAGAHISVLLPSGLVRQYSLTNDPDIAGSYAVAVLREADGRGGSREMYDDVRPGQVLVASGPRNNFELAREARKHVLVAGGIGITPIIAMARSLARREVPWQLHYCVRDLTKAAFVEVLGQAPFVDHLRLHIDGGNPSAGLKVEELVDSERRDGTHLYCCGPVALMERVRVACREWPAGTVHFEAFKARSEVLNSAFEVEIASTGEIVFVGPTETILEVLRRHGKFVPSLCIEGVCGTCVVDLLEGVAEHRDAVLFDHERTHRIAVCCSRAISRRLKLGL